MISNNDQQIIYNKYSSENYKAIWKLENTLSKMSGLKKNTCRETGKIDL